MQKFAFLTDLHYGFERRNGHKVPLHDQRAIDAALSFLGDFKPDTLILGGDILDCGAISHHNHGKPGRTEGLRLLADADTCSTNFIQPLKALRPKTVVYITGNHEAWLDDMVEEVPGIEGMLGLEGLLGLPAQWRVLPQGGKFHLGKLTFVHGDQLKGGAAVAKTAVIEAERSIRFGHFHTFQAYTKTSFVEEKLGRTGIAVPCLCTKDPKYGEGRGNSWVQGLNWGYVFPDGTYADYVSIITNGRMVVNGKVYRG
jgi:predicted phosphodiesterase